MRKLTAHFYANSLVLLKLHVDVHRLNVRSVPARSVDALQGDTVTLGRQGRAADHPVAMRGRSETPGRTGQRGFTPVATPAQDSCFATSSS